MYSETNSQPRSNAPRVEMRCTHTEANLVRGPGPGLPFYKGGVTDTHTRARGGGEERASKKQNKTKKNKRKWIQTRVKHRTPNRELQKNFFLSHRVRYVHLVADMDLNYPFVVLTLHILPHCSATQAASSCVDTSIAPLPDKQTDTNINQLLISS
eukprot:gene1146-674_t